MWQVDNRGDGFRCVGALVLAGAALLGAGCATRAPGGAAPLPPSSPARVDGPPASPPPPAELLRVPDALPALEPIRDGGPNKPYEVFGESYRPLRAEADYREEGLASWYGRAFHGRRTASGEVYNMYAMTAAHKTLPIPSYVRVRNPANGREVIVRVNDRGPFVKGRIIDLSYTAALKLDTLNNPTSVEVERITPEQIRSGLRRREVEAGPGADDGVARGERAPAPLPSTAPAVVPSGAQAAAPDEPAARAFTAPQRGFWVQLGAYRAREGALQLQQRAAERVEGLALLLAVFSEGGWHRVQAGPFETREEAQQQLRRIGEPLAIAPVVVQRR